MMKPRYSKASAFWLLDTVGAIGFAGFLAHILGQWVTFGEVKGGLTPIIALIACGIIRAVAQSSALIVGQLAAIGVKQGERGRLLAAILPTSMQRGSLTGQDMRVVIDDVESLEGWIARFLPLRTAAVLSPLIIALAVSVASWVAAAIMMFTLIPFAVGMILAGYAGKTEAEQQLAALTRLSGLFVDRVASLPVILANGAEDRVTKQIAGAAREVAERTMAVLRVAFLSSAVLEFFAALSVALVAMYCGFSLLGILPFPAPEQMSLSHAFFALTLAPEFYLGMRRMAAAYHEKQQGETAMASINAAMSSAAAHGIDAEGQAPLISASSAIRIENLRIDYTDGSTIGPISADWQGPGLHLVVGETGSGKSSLLHALLGLTPKSSGRIFVNGTLGSVGEIRPSVAWAGQRPLLLPGTIKDNVLLASPHQNWDLVRPLVHSAQLTNLIERRGSDLVIDARGSGLSGGERRRLGLVRAIASGRPIMLLDEPTADLDTETAQAIVGWLSKCADDRLIIIATHDEQFMAIAQSVTELP